MHYSRDSLHLFVTLQNYTTYYALSTFVHTTMIRIYYLGNPQKKQHWLAIIIPFNNLSFIRNSSEFVTYNSFHHNRDHQHHNKYKPPILYITSSSSSSYSSGLSSFSFILPTEAEQSSRRWRPQPTRPSKLHRKKRC